MGRSALIAAYCYLIGGDHDFSDTSRPVLDQARTSAGITIGDGAWLGAGAKVLDGVDIGAHAVIGAGAVVRDRSLSVRPPSACRRESWDTFMSVYRLPSTVYPTGSPSYG